MMENNCYSLVSPNLADTGIEQGDILKDVPLFDSYPIDDRFGSGKFEPVFDATPKTILVLTQTCDLVNGKMPERILIAEIASFSEVKTLSPNLLKDTKLVREMQLNIHPRFKLLPPLADEEKEIFEWHIIDFRVLNTIHSKWLTSGIVIPSLHLRMKSPSREDLSQSFAKNIMRVALTEELRTFDSFVKENMPK